jgi:hypothetical protein
VVVLVGVCHVEAADRRLPPVDTDYTVATVTHLTPPSCSAYPSAPGCLPPIGRRLPAALPVDNRTSSTELHPTCHPDTGGFGAGCLRLPNSTTIKVEASSAAVQLTLRPASSSPTSTIALAGNAQQGDVSSTAWIDYDLDGDLDLFITQGFGSSALLRNELDMSTGTVTFTSMSGGEVGTIVSDGGVAVHMAWADYDNDGDPDCYVSHRGSGGTPDALYINDGAGAFTTSPHFGDSGYTFDLSFSTGAAAWADYDNDT